MRSHKQELMARAVRHQQAGESAQAEALFQRLVREDPFHAEAWNLLAILTYQTGRGEAALDYFGRACAAAPTNAGYRSNRGAVLQGLGRLGEAETAYREALRLNPAHGEAANNLGNVLRALGRLKESETACRRALALMPANPEACNNLGSTLRDLERYDEAAACCRRALELLPGYPDAHYNLGLVMLIQGDYEHGWVEYEWRWKLIGLRGCELPPYPQPIWDGSALAGRTILLYPEQGFGDVFQFVRYAGLVKAQARRVAGGGTVLCLCRQPLAALLRTVPGVDGIVPEGSPLPPFDVYAPLLSLPRLLGTTVANVPARVPYIAADPALVDCWRERLAAKPRPQGRHCLAGEHPAAARPFPFGPAHAVRAAGARPGRSTVQSAGRGGTGATGGTGGVRRPAPERGRGRETRAKRAASLSP